MGHRFESCRDHSSDMKEKIDNLLEQLHKKEIDMIELRNQLLLLYNVSWRSEQLKAISDLKDFAYEVCPLHREDDLEEIVSRL